MQKIGVFVCHCGTNIAATVDVAAVAEALGREPSVVVSNEGGTGLGYSRISVRGVRGAQMNVTLNGVTLNDAESQEVFWVNIPALTEILSGIQLQPSRY